MSGFKTWNNQNSRGRLGRSGGSGGGKIKSMGETPTLLTNKRFIHQIYDRKDFCY